MARIATQRRTAKIDATQRHERRMGWFIAEAHRQAPNRNQRARCERFYDSEQWDAAKKAAIEARGQIAVTYNEIKPTIDWLIGTERRTRVDFRVMPRESLDAIATKDAETKTKLLKWLNDVNRVGFERSYAWDDAMKSGLGWLETGVRGDDTDTPIFVAAESWRNMLHDSLGSRLDARDWRYEFRIKVVDLDIALAAFPNCEEKLLKVRQEGDNRNSAAGWLMSQGGLIDLGLLSGDGYEGADDMQLMPSDLFNPRERVTLIECWSQEPLSYGRESASTYDRIRMGMHCSIMTEFDTLTEGESPYKHGRFPFIPKWAYRNKRTGMPYSPIWPLMEKQEALNLTMSKAWFEMSVNQTHAEADAFDEEVMTAEEAHDEVQDPNGMVLLKAGAMTGGKFKSIRGVANAQAFVAFADVLRGSIRDESSVTASNRGLDSNAVSGKAIGLQQDQGSVLSTELFDNDLLARQCEGEIVLSLAEQYMLKPRVIALSAERKQSQMIEVNKPMPDGTVLNDISARAAQFVVGEQAWRASLGQAAFEQTMDLLSKLAPVAPQIVTALLDLVFEWSEIPNKETVLERVRSITGQAGPDNKQTPEQQAAKQQQQQIAQAQFEAQMAQLQADIRAAQAKGEALEAKAMLDRLTALYEAAQGAAVLATNPAITPIADELLRSAGFKDLGGGPGLAAPGIDAGVRQPLPQPMDSASGQAMPAPIPDPLQSDGAAVGAQQGMQPTPPDGATPQ